MAEIYGKGTQGSTLAWGAASLLLRRLLYGRNFTIHDGVYHTALGGGSKIDRSITKRVPTPNDVPSETYQRDVSNADLFGTDTIPTVEISTHGKIGPGVCDIHRRRIRVGSRGWM